MHTKTVLFVDDHQGQAIKLHLLLEDGVGADNHLHFAAGNRVLLRKTCSALLFTGEPADFNAKRGKPVAEVVCVLLCKKLGRCHQRHLFAVGNRTQGGQCSNQRFTGTHVTLNQTHHWHIERHITFNLGDNARLCACRFKRQRCQQLIF